MAAETRKSAPVYFVLVHITLRVISEFYDIKRSFVKNLNF